MKRSELITLLFDSNEGELIDKFVHAEDIYDYENIVNYIIDLSIKSGLKPPGKWKVDDYNMPYIDNSWEPEDE